MQTEGYEKKKLWVLIGGFALLVAVIVIVALMNVVPKLGKVEVYVGYAPFIATVTLDGKQVSNNANNYLAPGEYKLKVSLEGFETLEKSVTVSEESKTLFGSIVANTEEGIRIANEHLDDYAAVQSLFGAEISAKGEKNRKEWPVIQKLPITNSLYKIGYVIEDGKIRLSLASYASNVNVAVRELKKAALAAKDDLAGYEIEFKNFKNDYEAEFRSNEMIDAEASLMEGFGGIADFKLVEGVQDGEYYYAKVTTGTDETYTLVERKVILKKADGGWKLQSEVSPILTIYNTVDVPVEIVRLANSL